MKKPNQFIKHLDIPTENKKRNKTWLFFKFAIVFFVLSTAIYGGVMFYNTHDFRSPILFQNPVPKKVNTIESPVASKRGSLINQVYAEEIKNPFDTRSPKGVSWQVNKDKFGIEHWEAFETLIFKESGWNPYAVNKSSGACGLGQALPCAKMGCELWDYDCQVNWIAGYIENRYTNPTKALVFHYEHNYY